MKIQKIHNLRRYFFSDILGKGLFIDKEINVVEKCMVLEIMFEWTGKRKRATWMVDDHAES